VSDVNNQDVSPFEGRLLIGATGSAAVATLPMYIGALRSVLRGPITVLMTHTATTFLPAHTVGLFADRVVTGQEAATWPRENHATLAAGHDLTVILPATAHTLSVTAAGAAPNMLATTVLAATHPVAFFPVMTGAMWDKPAVQRNVARLREDGHHVYDPAFGPRYDVAAGEFADSPQPPPPPRFIEIVRQLMTGGSVAGV
jgi:phosphopantothenoylcysteine decarboxylase